MRRVIACGIMFMGLAVAPAAGATIRVMVSAVNGLPLPMPSAVIEVAPGDLLSLEMYAEGWTPQALRAYQLTIDPTGLTSGGSGTLEPVVASAAIDAARPDFAFAGFSVVLQDQQAFAAVDTSTSAYRWTSGVFSFADAVADGGPVYLAALTLDVSADAAGLFTVGLNAASTFLRNGDMPPAPIMPLVVVPAEVTVANDGGDCLAFAECADVVPQDGLRDDSCMWWSCDGGACTGTSIVFADMGGSNGACPPDNATDGNDRFHALNCFSNRSTLGLAGYPCEPNPPLAFNADAGGPFGQCCPDGVCDGNDAFHALNAFEGLNPCSCPANFTCPCAVPTDPPGNPVLCPAGPAPVRPPGAPTPRPASTAFAVVASADRIEAGRQLQVEVRLSELLADLRGYQLHLDASGGQRGTLKVVDVAIEARKDAALSGQPTWSAFNVDIQQIVVGMDRAGVAVASGSYLATFTLQASPDARGDFAIRLLHDPNMAAHRTFLFPTTPGQRIDITPSRPAVVQVVGTTKAASKRVNR